MAAVSHQLYVKDRDFTHQITFSALPLSPLNLNASFHVVAEPGDNSEPNDPIYTLEKYHLPHHLDPKLSKLVIIDSVKSGKGRTTDGDIYKNSIVPILKIIGLHDKHDYYETETKDSIHQLARSLINSEVTPNKDLTVLLLSGDTSIHEFINGLPQTSAPRNINLGVIPLGSGNAFALELGVTSAINGVLKVFSDSSGIQKFPVHQASFSPGSYIQDPEDEEKIDSKSYISSLKFFVVLSWGLHAAIVGDSDSLELRKLGNDRFRIAAYNNINSILQNYEGEVVRMVNGVRVNDENQITCHSYFLLSLVKSLEANFTISPHSDFISGKSYIIDIPFKNLSLSDHSSDSSEKVNCQLQKQKEFLAGILEKVYVQSSHIDDPDIVYRRVFTESNESLLVFVKDKEARKRRICVDGRIVILDNDGSDTGVHGDQKYVKIDSFGNKCNGWSLSLIV
ncbi:hypothetical protein DASC09_048210 [Saccharomycopsis crataegensis]|uniref:DAGKc domain-containing protein n=1 Tax=Saccharomycopsis crataegensis TaxID=43959 RepID=A0AAV5QRZ6_9ASCO|nr:hypothetical protein DASC09_048210 [Saccharomycopsis crataegensis]